MPPNGVGTPLRSPATSRKHKVSSRIVHCLVFHLLPPAGATGEARDDSYLKAHMHFLTSFYSDPPLCLYS